jgi:hypothetical protein
MGILDNAKSMAEKVMDKAPDLLDKVGDQVEKLEQKGGTVGKFATSGHKVIDKLGEKLPAAKTEEPTEPTSPSTTAEPSTSSEPPATTEGADPEGPTEFGTSTD